MISTATLWGRIVGGLVVAGRHLLVGRVLGAVLMLPLRRGVGGVGGRGVVVPRLVRGIVVIRHIGCMRLSFFWGVVVVKCAITEYTHSVGSSDKM